MGCSPIQSTPFNLLLWNFMKTLGQNPNKNIISRRTKARKISNYRKVFLGILPFLIFLLIFYLFPLLRLVKFSLIDPDFTLKHYAHVFRETTYLKVLWITMKVSLIVTFSCLFLGYPLAYFFVHLKKPLQLQDSNMN